MPVPIRAEEPSHGIHDADLRGRERAVRPQRPAAGRGAITRSWTAYVQALAQSGIMKGGNGLQLPETGDHGPAARRQAARSGRPVCRQQGAARRLLHPGRAESRRGAGLGGALPGRTGRLDRDPAGHGDAAGLARGGRRAPCRRNGGARRLRPAAGLSLGAQPRRGGGRGRAGGGVPRRRSRLGPSAACPTGPKRGCSPPPAAT